MRRAVCIALIFACIALCSCRNEKEYSETVYAMDTVMELKAYGENGEKALELCVEEIRRLDEKWRRGSESSEIYELNYKKNMTVSDETAELIKRALEASDETKGAFDISLAPVSDLWGFYTKEYYLPTGEEIKNALFKTGPDKIEINGNNVRLGENTSIDLGGIAKGYLSERIAGIFKRCGVKSGIASLGGNVQAIGKRPGGKNWNVAVQSPEGEGYLGIVSVSDKAVITSGGYQRFFEKNGKVYHHIIDPQTGYPAESGLTSVTVVSGDPAFADALSTAIFVMGKDKGLKYRDKKGGFELILADNNGNIFITSGLEKNFSSEYKYEIIK